MCHHGPNRRRAGFTLVEALVVTAILAILFGLTTAAVINAYQGAEDKRVLIEMKQLENAIAGFKAKFGASYMPSYLRLRENMDYKIGPAPAPLDPIDKESWDFLSNMFPRLQLKVPVNWGQTAPINLANARDLQGHECLTFLLGGRRHDPSPGNNSSPLGGYIGFSSNPANPMAPPTPGETAVGPFFEFDPERLIPRTTLAANFPGTNRNTFPSYKDPYNSNPPMPYLYFSGNRAGVYNNKICLAAAPCNWAPNREYVSPYRSPNGQAYNQNTFQIICAGRDGEFGRIFTNTISPPGAPFQYMDWNNSVYAPGTQSVLRAPTPSGIKAPQLDDLANFHPNKLGIPK